MDLIDCGIDNSAKVQVGDVEIKEYPWVGILYYMNHGEAGEQRAVTTVALIHVLFVIAPAADVGPMPKNDFRANTRVLLGDKWNGEERRVRSYVLHPEYGQTYNTIALVQLRESVLLTKYLNIRPLCPPPDLLRNPEFYVVKFKEDYNNLQKEVIPVIHVPGNLCKDFYVSANLYTAKMRPPHVACVTSPRGAACVWGAGAALAARDAWGRWMLLGLGVRGPGCGMPSRFLDMMSYYPWIESSLDKFSQVTISKIHEHKYVLRSSDGMSKSLQRYGDCDYEEQQNLIYRELIILQTDNNQYQFLTYNMTIADNVEYTCLTLEVVNASAVSEMRVKHMCPRPEKLEGKKYRGPCHTYRLSTFDISVYMMFSDKFRFEMYAWGFPKDMKLLDIQEWKWEEGTYYEDFSISHVEYKGTQEQTGFGFEPLDETVWVPDYDVWASTIFDNTSTTRIPGIGYFGSHEEPPPTNQDFELSKIRSTFAPATDDVNPRQDFDWYGIRDRRYARS
ncbi:uncharacterized protein LOC106131720 [Amyelois transitella]|uniref:uncharacterized protein LOC106131720 n=1 Tax=Amyelois transitella TaxID=680683 RepID=UPI00067C783A|nr:uncharacterized protein LOC106131720 [Amyelois transitella]